MKKCNEILQALTMCATCDTIKLKGVAMSAKTHRINVTLDPEDLEIIQIISNKQKLSKSSVIKKMVHEWLEDYEDMLLIKKIEERENENNPLISHEEYWELEK
jgi:uncharacterized protein DUF6290